MRSLGLVVVLAGFFAQIPVALAQTSPALVDQISPRRTVPARRATTPTTATREIAAPSTNAQRQIASQTEALSSELLAACQAGVAPEGVRCPQAPANNGGGRPPGTAEGTLLQIFGVPRSFTTTSDGPIEGVQSADEIARQLAAEGGTNPDSQAAAVAARQRSSPPPTSPRR